MQQRDATVMTARRELDQIVSRNAVDLKKLLENLNRLKTVEMDLDLLKRSKIGLTVNNVRKTFKSSKEVSNLTADLIRQWKKIAKNEFRILESKKKESGTVPRRVADTTSTDSTDTQPNAADVSSSSSSDGPSPSISSDKNESNSISKKEKMLKSAGKLRIPGDETRRKSVDMLEEALRTEPEGSERSKQVAVEMEKHIYREMKETDRKYRSRVRSRVLNLRGAGNPELRRRLLSGELSPKDVARMSSEEMASRQMQEMRRSISEEMMREHEIPETGLTHSSMFLCPKCAQRDTSYTLSQERQEGEYEPIEVTHLLCNHCGHRWKTF